MFQIIHTKPIGQKNHESGFIMRTILCLFLLAFCSVAHADQRLLNKKAIVTGANKGIGQAIAIGFAKEGADIVKERKLLLLC